MRIERAQSRPDSPASLLRAEKVLYAGVGFFPNNRRPPPPPPPAADPDDRPATPPLPVPPPVPPSKEAARAALNALVQRVGEGDALDEAVANPTLGAAAAEAICWSRTPLPDDLLAVLRNHANNHLAEHHSLAQA